MFFNPSLYAVGGMQAWLASLMPELRRRGWDVWLALPSGPHNDAAAYLTNYPWEPHAIVENPTRTRIGRRLAVMRTVERLRPDVLVVANLASAFPAVQELRARGRWAPRLAACVHTLDGGIFADVAKHRPVVDGLVAPNRLIAMAATVLCRVPPDRVHLARYVVDRPPLPEDSRDVQGLEIVFAHRLDHEQKRALDLPGIVAGLARRGVDFTLDVAGDGVAAAPLRQALRTEVARGRVRFLGTIPPAELREQVLRAGRVCLVLSTWENGPLVAWQAMAWGCPLATSCYVGSGLEGFLRDGENALTFPVGDVEGAADALARLADPRLRRRLVECAWADVGDRFSGDAAGAAWDRALRQVLDSPPLPRPTPPAPVASAGRLDRLFGPRGAERVRRALRRPVATFGSGDEWPHTGSPAGDADELIARLAALDGVALPASVTAPRLHSLEAAR